MARDIIISRRPDPTEHKLEMDCEASVWLTCENFEELDNYIAVAKRMRPDRIIINYDEYLHSK